MHWERRIRTPNTVVVLRCPKMANACVHPRRTSRLTGTRNVTPKVVWFPPQLGVCPSSGARDPRPLIPPPSETVVGVWSLHAHSLPLPTTSHGGVEPSLKEPARPGNRAILYAERERHRKGGEQGT